MSQQLTLSIREHSWLKQFLLALSGSFLIGLCAHIAIPLPFSPIPLALQPHVCLFLAAFLGRKLGTWAVILFLVQGALGLPVFALGRAGLPVLIGPTAGYLLGYLISAWLVGYLVEKSATKTRLVIALAIGNLVIYLCGILHLSQFIGIQNAFLLGMCPFLMGDFFKIILVYKALRCFRT